MRTKPILYDDSRPAEPIGIPAGVAHRIGARLLHEFREALPPTIYFFVSFNFIVLTSHLLVAQYLVAASSFMLATLAALVVGKAVLVANKMPWHCQLKRSWYARHVGGTAARVGELLCSPIMLPRSSRAGPEKGALGPLS